jgi:hypothetical protein
VSITANFDQWNISKFSYQVWLEQYVLKEVLAVGTLRSIAETTPVRFQGVEKYLQSLSTRLGLSNQQKRKRYGFMVRCV